MYPAQLLQPGKLAQVAEVAAESYLLINLLYQLLLHHQMLAAQMAAPGGHVSFIGFPAADIVLEMAAPGSSWPTKRTVK